MRHCCHMIEISIQVIQLIENLFVCAFKNTSQLVMLCYFWSCFSSVTNIFLFFGRSFLLSMRFNILMQIGQFLDVDCLAESIVIVFKLFLSFLYKIFLSITKKFFMREIRQIILKLSLQTFIMQLSQFTISSLDDDRLLIIAFSMDLHDVINCAIIIISLCELEEIFGLALHYEYDDNNTKYYEI